ncbi:hypothetical protein J6590_005373 [Homalodisca vitripennis]|nr:hypothetical protein J6590_005373 [Homalodisca vitripennis]
MSKRHYILGNAHNLVRGVIQPFPYSTSVIIQIPAQRQEVEEAGKVTSRIGHRAWMKHLVGDKVLIRIYGNSWGKWRWEKTLAFGRFSTFFIHPVILNNLGTLNDYSKRGLETYEVKRTVTRPLINGAAGKWLTRRVLERATGTKPCIRVRRNNAIGSDKNTSRDISFYSNLGYRGNR